MWFSYWLRCDWRGKKRPRVYRWSERNKPPSLGERRWQEDISVWWLKLSMSCFTSYLPSPVFSLPLSGIFSTHRRRALPTRLRCQSEAYLPSRLLHLFCHFSLVSVQLDLSLVSYSRHSAWHRFFLFALLTSPRGRGCSICWCQTDHTQHACSVILKMRWLK